MANTPALQAQIDAIIATAQATPVAVLETPRPATLDERIAEARLRLLNQVAAPEAGKLEAPDKDVISTLLAEQSEWKRIIDEATKERAKITDFFADLIVANENGNEGSIEELTVHGATVFTYKTVTSRTLDTAHIKSLFPDIPENAEMWSEGVQRRKVFK